MKTAKEKNRDRVRQCRERLKAKQNQYVVPEVKDDVYEAQEVTDTVPEVKDVVLEAKEETHIDEKAEVKEEVKVKDDNQKFKDIIISNCLKYHSEEIPYSEELSKEELKKRLDILRKEYHENYMRLLFQNRDEVQPILDDIHLKIK